MKIGLRRGIVELIPHQEEWRTAFEKEKKRLMGAGKGIVIDIQHVGSTSIKGIPAKPIIDMTGGVKNIKDIKKLVEPLSSLGYAFYRQFGNEYLFIKESKAKRTHHLRVLKYKGSKWKTDALFRDYLLSHPKRAKAYGILKKKLAKQYPADRVRYTEGKNTFVETTIRLAKKASK